MQAPTIEQPADEELLTITIRCDECDGTCQVRAHVTLLGRSGGALERVQGAPEGWQVDRKVRRCPLHAAPASEAA